MHRTAVVGTALATATAAALIAGCRAGETTVDGRGQERPRARADTSASARETPRPRRTFTHEPTAEPSAKAVVRSPRTTEPAPPRRTAPRVAPPVIAFGTTSDRVRELQARLRALGLFHRNPTGYFGTVTQASVSAYQRGHGLTATGSVDQRTWASLRSATKTPSHDALYPPTTLPLAKPDPRCKTGRVLCISKSSRTLAWMINGRVVSAMDVRFGSEYTPTREGLFQVNFKSRDHVSTIYDTPMPYAMFFSGGQAVHYSADFAARGYSGASHGCVNVRDKKKIAALFDQVKAGDKVVVYK
ncbi:L,D-transpeptidase family protein [Streptomyces luomodiensis]|uniref:L,D-transpeptidase family protein n=1 Tax=Streptomyces luomodiensis TaxID=3026192 RepID=A0ABY9V356_9ACTN|nr:L,D-transpeptidase family protein [Streptomyces sp. SCA4-21]WNE97135.1 L,D-transpeptidase family protein [Streptomyces sp. SCA4-21]